MHGFFLYDRSDNKRIAHTTYKCITSRARPHKTYLARHLAASVAQTPEDWIEKEQVW